jgi:hypothetical protein
MRILVDMNLSPRWVDLLADAGIESVHWSSVGETTASDSFIMAFAKGAGYVVLTHDLDFGSILAATHGDKPSDGSRNRLRRTPDHRTAPRPDSTSPIKSLMTCSERYG